jgi:Uma2 family endonuclease
MVPETPGGEFTRERVSAHHVEFGPYTVLDLHELPEDGKGVEIEDGWLIEMAAGPRHNWVAWNLSRVIEAASVRASEDVVVCGGGAWEISTAAGIRKPDVFVLPRGAARATILREWPKVIPGRQVLMAAEVVTPGGLSECTDRVEKRRDYARVGIPRYWIVDHQPGLQVQVMTLGERGYVAKPVVTAGSVLTAEIEADKPFSVSFDPAALLEF